MQVIKSPQKLAHLLFKLKQNAKWIGFVPTMGYLHEGHLSLTRRAKKENDIVVVSIFVNPAQFGPKEDFKNYPRSIKKDLQMLRDAKVDYVLLPSVASVYPSSFDSYLKAGPLAHSLCGLRRPGHFDGVVTVVKRLFDIVLPDNAYFGQKDFQQVCAVQDLVKRFNLPVRIVMCPTIPEGDSLAMSSRNRYLTSEKRKRAHALSESLRLTKKLIQKRIFDSRVVRKQIIQFLKPYVDKIDYVEVVNAHNLRKIQRLKGDVLVAIACFLGKARLIDNLLIHV